MSSSGPTKRNAFATLMGASQKATTAAVHKKHKKTLKSFFPAKKNHQGFPIKECKFQKSEGAYMYRPWWYGRAYTNDPASRGIYPTYCKHCKLQPCLIVEEKNTMPSMGKHVMEHDKRSPAQARLIIANRLEMKRRRIFNLDFGAPPSHTQCMTEFVDLWFPDKQREDFWAPTRSPNFQKTTLLEDNDEDAELPHFDYDDSEEAQEDDEEDTPLVLLRDHECGDVPLEDKVKSYRVIQAKQKAADRSLEEKQTTMRSTKDMLAELKEESDNDWEF